MNGKRSITVLMSAIIAGLFLMATFTSTSLAKTVEISYVTWKAGHPQQVMAKDLIKRIEEKSSGAIQFVSRGNEESISPRDQVGAVSAGIVDSGMLPMALMADRMPIANALSVIPSLTSQEMKAKGIWEIFQKNAQKKGLYLICKLDSSNYNHQSRLWINKKITKPEDIEGMKLRTISKYAVLAKKYGASPMNIPAPDLYTSVQQGLVDGFFMSFAAMDLGLGEVTKYYIDPGFGCSDEVFYMNFKKWNKIPAEMQALIAEEVNAVEKEWEAKWDEQYNIQKERAAKQGVKVIKLSEKEGERFVNSYTDLVWEDVIKRAPKDGKELRKLCGLPSL